MAAEPGQPSIDAAADVVGLHLDAHRDQRVRAGVGVDRGQAGDEGATGAGLGGPLQGVPAVEPPGLGIGRGPPCRRDPELELEVGSEQGPTRGRLGGPRFPVVALPVFAASCVAPRPRCRLPTRGGRRDRRGRVPTRPDRAGTGRAALRGPAWPARRRHRGRATRGVRRAPLLDGRGRSRGSGCGRRHRRPGGTRCGRRRRGVARAATRGPAAPRRADERRPGGAGGGRRPPVHCPAPDGSRHAPASPTQAAGRSSTPSAPKRTWKGSARSHSRAARLTAPPR